MAKTDTPEAPPASWAQRADEANAAAALALRVGKPDLACAKATQACFYELRALRLQEHQSQVGMLPITNLPDPDQAPPQ
jgi:hypothetical protein